MNTCPTCGGPLSARLAGGKCEHCGSTLINPSSPERRAICELCLVKTATEGCDICGTAVCEAHGRPFVESAVICPNCLECVPDRQAIAGRSLGRTAIIQLLHCINADEIPIRQTEMSVTAPSTWYWSPEEALDPGFRWYIDALGTEPFSSLQDAEHARASLIECVARARRAWSEARHRTTR